MEETQERNPQESQKRVPFNLCIILIKDLTQDCHISTARTHKNTQKAQTKHTQKKTHTNKLPRVLQCQFCIRLPLIYKPLTQKQLITIKYTFLIKKLYYILMALLKNLLKRFPLTFSSIFHFTNQNSDSQMLHKKQFNKYFS